MTNLNRFKIFAGLLICAICISISFQSGILNRPKAIAKARPEAFALAKKFHVDAVQATTGTEELTVPDTFDDSNKTQWTQIEANLVNTTYSVYILHWHGFGGLVEMAHVMEKAMVTAEQQGKQIIIDLNGDSYSCHAIVISYATKILHVSEHVVMFHADGYDIYRMSKTNSSTLADFAQCVKVGLITQADLDKLWQGYELWKISGMMLYAVDARPVAPAMRLF